MKIFTTDHVMAMIITTYITSVVNWSSHILFNLILMALASTWFSIISSLGNANLNFDKGLDVVGLVLGFVAKVDLVETCSGVILVGGLGLCVVEVGLILGGVGVVVLRRAVVGYPFM